MAKSLLVVDDSATMRKIITRTIRKADLSVEDEILEAGDGSEALEKLKGTDTLERQHKDHYDLYGKRRRSHRRCKG